MVAPDDLARLAAGDHGDIEAAHPKTGDGLLAHDIARHLTARTGVVPRHRRVVRFPIPGHIAEFGQQVTRIAAVASVAHGAAIETIEPVVERLGSGPG